MDRLIWTIAVAVVVIWFLLWFLRSAIKVVPEYERGVVFRLGRVQGARGPGLFLLIPIIDKMVRVDLRTVTLDVPAQETITRDNVTIRVNAVCYFRVLEPVASVVNVANFQMATMQIAQTTLRSVLGQSELDEILAQRDQINQTLQRIIDDQTEPWGVKVSIVEVKDLELPEGMKRAMARQAEAEREKRAKIIHAEGELQASQGLAQAAQVMATQPGALQLRYLATLAEIGAEHNSTIVFPLPLEFMRAFTGTDRLPAPMPVAPLPILPMPEPLPMPDPLPLPTQPTFGDPSAEAGADPGLDPGVGPHA